MKYRPMEAKLYDADRRTDMTKLVATLLNFANTPKILPQNWRHGLKLSLHSLDVLLEQ
jgi:hypothetical protein